MMGWRVASSTKDRRGPFATKEKAFAHESDARTAAEIFMVVSLVCCVVVDAAKTDGCSKSVQKVKIAGRLKISDVRSWRAADFAREKIARMSTNHEHD